MSDSHLAVDLSRPDNSEYRKGRPLLARALWHFFGFPLVRSDWVPISSLKAALLRLFGASIGRGVCLKPGIRVKFPWYLAIGDHCWIGESAWIDNLTRVNIGSNVCVSQGAYLGTGNHDWTTPNMKLFTRPITLRDGSWVGAKSIVCPGVTFGEGAVLAAGSVATRDIPSFEIWAGNPARFVRTRRLRPLTPNEPRLNSTPARL
jgi:putative colanic acid biosynthesis acetyltransferase WcaF